ncbi:MAG TPA: replication initiation protein [Aquabacterium sp.]|nr:replication initiation protein [Aquabacterium sp.]
MDASSSRKRKDATAPATLNKPVVALAIVPLNRSLTVTARKAYNVMLHIAQREGDTGEAGFSAPLNAILRGFGSGNNIATDAKRYIDQMMSTKIEWRPLSEGEQWLLPLDEPGAAADTSGRGAAAPRLDGPTEELRSFHMLSEVRLYKRAGENWVTWFYPPTIKEQMLGPHRWARLELEVIARLSTYTAVALYEICARYRDNPGGVTSRHPWDWWVQVLRGSEGSKQREWRKFKNEFVNPAIREINAVSDIEVELAEYKQGRAIADVQFAVRKKPAQSMPNKPEPPDVTGLLRAARLGVRETEAETLIERFGDEAMAAALDAMERFIEANAGKPIVNKAAYLKAILVSQEKERLPADRAPGALAAPASPGHAGPERNSAERAGSAAAHAGPQPLRQVLDQLGGVAPSPGGSDASAPPAAAPRLTTEADDQQASVLQQLRRRFELLEPTEQAAWVARLAAHAAGSGSATPNVMRRLQAGQWQSPLVTAMLMRFYAEQTFGSDWARLDPAHIAGLPAMA